METEAPPTFDGVVNDLHPVPVAPDNAPSPTQPSLHDVYQSVAHLPSPDASAQVLNLAKITGQDAQFVSDHKPDIEKAVSAPSKEDFDVISRNFPVTAAALLDNKTMASAYDDTDNMVAHEHINKKLSEAHGLADAVKAGFQGSILGMIGRQATPDIAIGPNAKFSEKFTQSATQFALDFPYMAAGGVLVAAAAAPAGPIAAGLAGYGASFAVPDAMRETLKQHFDSGDSDSAADLLRQMFTGKTLKAGVKGFATGVLTGAAGGAFAPLGKIASGAAEVATMTGAGAALNGTKIDAEDVASNALLIALMHGAGAAGEYGLDRAFPNRVAETIRLGATTDAATLLDETSRASKWRNRDPEGYEKLMNAGKPVRIPVAAYESLFQAAGKDPELVSNDLGVAASHNEARGTGGDVVIPQGKWLSKDMDPYRAKFIDDIKFDADDLTRNQVGERDKAVKDRMTQLMADSDAAIKAEPERKEAHDAIQQKTEELLAKNGLDPKQAKANSQIVAAHYTAEAARRGQGESAQALYDREFPALSQKMFGIAPDLTPEQVLEQESRTPQFKKWFKKSSVIDQSGKPIVVYHGSGTKIDEFKYEHTGQGNDHLGSGFYFTTKEDEAHGYKTSRRASAQDVPKPGGEDNPNVIKAYLSIQNPLDAEAVGEISAEQARRLISMAPSASKRSGLENWAGSSQDKINEAYSSEGQEILRGLFPIANDFYGNDTKAFNKAVKKVLGYDGVVKHWDGFDHYVAFFPEQIKSALGNSGKFDANNPDILKQEAALTQSPSYPILSGDGTERGSETGSAREDGSPAGRGSPGESAGRGALLEAPIRPEARHSEPLTGALPKGFPGPTPEIRQAAEIYSRSIGLPDRQPGEYVKADPERGARIAKAFEAMKHEPNDPLVKRAYDGLISQTLDQLRVMDKMGVKYEAIPAGKPSPYKNSADMIADVRSGHLWYFPTTEGFGSDAQFNDHPLMAATDAKDANGKPMLANDVFRVVHDFFGHAKEGNGFGPHGEENAWQSHVRMYTPDAAAAMTTETRGQNSWVNFGPFAEVNRANPGTKYADQKAGLLPEFVNTEGIANDRDALFQEESNPKGEYVPALNEIRLGKNADASTYMHEFFHGALAHMFDFVKSGNANEEYLNHFEAMSKFLGIKDDQESLTREQQEKGARAFERYLRGEDTSEGGTKAPSAELRGAFGMFRKWLTQVYRQIKGSPIEGEITDDARGFFDRMLASEDQIAQAQRETGYNPSEIQSIQGLDPAMAKRVRTLQERAHDQAVEALLKDQMSEMRDDNKKTMDAERQRLTAQVSPEVDALPVHQAGDDLQDAFGKKQVPADYAKNFLEGKANEHESSQFEAIAELNGFQDGHDMAQKIVAAWQAGGKDAEIEKRVEAGMAPLADLKDTDAIKARALEIIHSSRSTELLALEQRALEDLQHKKEVAGEVTKRRRADAALEAAQVKAQARELLASKPVGEAGAFRSYFTAERNAAVRVSEALAKEDYEGAAKAKREQMMNHALAAEALRNKAEIGRTMKFLNKFGGRGGELLKMPYGFVHQIDDLLASRGLAEPKTDNDATLLKVAQGMSAKDADPADIANATGFMQGDDGKWRRERIQDFVARVNDNYYALTLPDSVMQRPQADSLKQAARQMTMGDLRDVRDTVKAISGIGKEFESFLNAFIKNDIKSAGLEIQNSITEKHGAPRADETKPGHQYSSKWKEFLASLKDRPQQYINDQKTLLTLCDILDAGDTNGPMKKYIYRPLKMAYDNREVRTEKYRNDINELLSKHYTPSELADYKNQKFQFEFSKNADGSPRTWYKDEILAIARNWGNLGNRDRIMRGFKFDETQVNEMMSNLSKKDFDANQDIFEHLQSYWPDIVKQEMKVQGFEPHQVEPETIKTPYGDYKGGYYPIKYDFEKSIEASRNEVQKNELFKQMSAAAAHTDKGHVQSRVNTLSRPIRLSADVLVNHIENVNHDLAFRETVIDTNRLLRRPEVREAITGAIGQDGLKTIEDHLRAVASDQGNYVDGAEAALRWFRFKATMSTLAVRPFIFPLRFGGDVINAVSELGPTGTLSAMKGFWLGDGTREFVDSKSVLMKNFSHEFERDVFDVSNSFEGQSDIKKTYLKYAFAADTFADQIMRYPMWNKIYANRISEHGDDMRAVNEADEAITRSFGSGRSLDQVQAQRGSEFQKATTMYMSWSTMMFNRWLRGAGIATSQYYQGNPGAAGATLIKAATFTFLLPALYDTFVREAMHNVAGGAVNEDPDEKKKRLLANAISAPFGNMWIARDIAPVLVKQAMHVHTTGFKASPMEDAIQTIMDTVKGGEKAPELIAKSASYLTGTPQELNTLVHNFIDWQKGNGELTWRDFLTHRSKK